MVKKMDLMESSKLALKQVVGFPKLIVSFQTRRWQTTLCILGEALVIGFLMSYFTGSTALTTVAAMGFLFYLILIGGHALSEQKLYKHLGMETGTDLGGKANISAANNNWRLADQLHHIAINDVVVGTLALREAVALRLEARYAVRTYWLRFKKLCTYFVTSWVVGLIIVPLAVFWFTVAFSVSDPAMLAEYLKSFIHALGANQASAERFMTEMGVIAITYWKLVVGLVTTALYIYTIKIYDEEFARRIRIKTECSSTGVVEIIPVTE